MNLQLDINWINIDAASLFHKRSATFTTDLIFANKNASSTISVIELKKKLHVKWNAVSKQVLMIQNKCTYMENIVNG